MEKIPKEERRYKCHICFTIVNTTPCPVCGDEHPTIMCPLDHCNCHDDVLTTHSYCPICGAAICPQCGTHDILAISRVTGYLQDVGGWNHAKQQELKDRTRYNPIGVANPKIA